MLKEDQILMEGSEDKWIINITIGIQNYGEAKLSDLKGNREFYPFP